jgi:CRP-like cAMP-binding protein
MFGELLALAGGNYRGWLIAEEPSRIRELGRLELISLLNKEQFRQFYFNEISRRVTKMTEKIEILSHQKILDRLVLFLLQQNRGSGPFRFNVTGTAEVLDCSREALSRALSELERTGAVRREQNLITIIDEPALEELLLGM